TVPNSNSGGTPQVLYSYVCQVGQYGRKVCVAKLPDGACDAAPLGSGCPAYYSCQYDSTQQISLCVGGASAGGPCRQNSDCQSNQCGTSSTGSTSVCLVPAGGTCDPYASNGPNCAAGFDCLQIGGTYNYGCYVSPGNLCNANTDCPPGYTVPG